MVARRLPRRRFLKSAGAAVGLAMVGGQSTPEPSPGPAATAASTSFSRVVDLTHPLGPDFPTYGGTPQLEAGGPNIKGATGGPSRVLALV